MSSRKKRKLPIVLALILVIIIALGVMVKWNSNYTENVSGNVDIYNKFKDIVLKGGTISFSSDEVNSIIENSFKSGQTHGGVTIKNVYVDFVKDSMEIKIPVEVKGVSFLVSSTGKLSLKDGGILFTPNGFKVGALPIPKNLVLNKLKSVNIDKISVSDDGIYVSKDQIPVTINSINIVDSKLNIGVGKLNINNSQVSKIRDELMKAAESLNESDRKKVQEAIKLIDSNPNDSSVLNSIRNKLNGVSSNDVLKIINSITNGSDNNNESSNTTNNGVSSTNTNSSRSLDADTASGLSKDLGTAAQYVKDPGGRAVVEALKAQAASGRLDQSVIKPQFKALNNNQRNEVINAVVNHVNPLLFTQISNIFK